MCYGKYMYVMVIKHILSIHCPNKIFYLTKFYLIVLKISVLIADWSDSLFKFLVFFQLKFGSEFDISSVISFSVLLSLVNRLLWSLFIVVLVGS